MWLKFEVKGKYSKKSLESQKNTARNPGRRGGFEEKYSYMYEEILGGQREII
jgi:hypothetical protein